MATSRAAFDWGKTHLPELTLPEDELLVHPQSILNILLSAEKIVDGTGEGETWSIPGDDLLNSSTKGGTRFVSMVSGDPKARVTIYWDSYNKDPALIEKARLKHRETCRRSYDARPHMGKLRLHRASPERSQITDVQALAAFAEAAGATAPPAAYEAAAARDAARALAAASRAAAPLEDAAGAVPVRPTPSLPDDAAAASSSAPRASSDRAVAATVSSAPTPAVASPAQSDGDVVMIEATSPSAAAAPHELADDVLARLDDEDVQEALAAADEPAPSDAFEAYVNALNRPTFDAGVSLMLRGLYASLPQRIALGTRPRFGWLGAALVAASLSTPDHTVTEADVRGGVARPFLPFAREDRRRRAHERPSSATPRRAGPRSGRARAFLGR